jgi:hypothetical protein
VPIQLLEYLLDLLGELLFLINILDNQSCQVEVLEELGDLRLPLRVLLDRFYVLVFFGCRFAETVMYRVKIQFVNEPEDGQHVIM